MNDRIKALAEQARIKDHWSIDEARYLTNYLDEKKFAELIVRECAKNAVLFAGSTTIQGLPSKHIENYMLKHFGVE